MPPEDHNPYSGYGAPTKAQLDEMVENQQNSPQQAGGGPAATVQHSDSEDQLLGHSEALAEQRAEANGFNPEAEVKSEDSADDAPADGADKSEDKDADKADAKAEDDKSDDKSDDNKPAAKPARGRATAKAADKK